VNLGAQLADAPAERLIGMPLSVSVVKIWAWNNSSRAVSLSILSSSERLSCVNRKIAARILPEKEIALRRNDEETQPDGGSCILRSIQAQMAERITL
jgi:hypothetical protein